MHTPRSTSHRRTVESKEALERWGCHRQRRAGWKLLIVSEQQRSGISPGQHETGAGVVGARPCGTPLDGVDLFTVRLQVVDTCVLLHTPDLKRTQTASQHSFIPIMLGAMFSLILAFFLVQHPFASDLQSHVIRTGGQQAAGGIPLDGIHLVLQSQIITGISAGVRWRNGAFLKSDRRAVPPCVLGRS